MRTSVRITGPLAPYAEGCHKELIKLGYTPLSAIVKLGLLAHLSRWIESGGFRPEDITKALLEQYIMERREAGYTHARSLKGMETLLTYLRHLGVIPEPQETPKTEVEQLVDIYCSYLHTERGLAHRSIECYQPIALQFLASCFPSGVPVLLKITAPDVTAFMLKEYRRRTGTHTKSVVVAVRSLLRFLYIQGWTATPLMSAVPSFASWRVAALPRPVNAEHVAQILHTCDRRTSAGRRTYAIFLLLTRLGLRAGEVAAMKLDDINWTSGELLVRGKNRSQDRLPLPPDVGQALADYLRYDRPQVPTRALFLRRFAPIGPITRSVVTGLVGQACKRAGLPRFGPHRLRHTVATEMLRSGESLSTIAQVLRHRSMDSTAFYAKVDRTALRTLAHTWPGGKS